MTYQNFLRSETETAPIDESSNRPAEVPHPPASIADNIATTTTSLEEEAPLPEPKPSPEIPSGPKPPQHTFRKDGYVEVNLATRHPMHDLIERSQERWKAKLERQSKTLAEAVKEYEKRYNRSPPPGFDKWYALIA